MVSRDGLVPLRHFLPDGGIAHYFVDTHIDIVRLDFVFPAGTALQEKPLQASTAIRLITEGTVNHRARDIAEFMDFRGIVVEKSVDEVSATLTVYSLRRYIEELLPLLREIIVSPTYPDDEFALYVENRRRHLLTEMMKTSFIARNIFYEHLYGSQHPMGKHAVPEDFDRITVDDIRRYHKVFFRPENAAIIIGGHVDDELLGLFDRYFGDFALHGESLNVSIPNVIQAEAFGNELKRSGNRGITYSLSGAVQNTLRIGRLLPMKWDSIDYARFVVLSTVLGGYFGSRLMSNIREDKGFTYGIYAQTRICRGSLLFSISTDVASENAERAITEIMYELQRLCIEPVSAEELDLVRKCMLGDFMRSVDGIFERCERFGYQLVAGINERFTDNYFSAVDNVTPEQLQHIAKQLFRPEELLIVNVGEVTT